LYFSQQIFIVEHVNFYKVNLKWHLGGEIGMGDFIYLD